MIHGHAFQERSKSLRRDSPQSKTQCCPLEELGRLLRETSLYAVISDGTFIPLVERNTHKDYGLVEPETKVGNSQETACAVCSSETTDPSEQRAS